MSEPSVTCPNCGYGFEALRRSTRMFDCPSCGTTLFRGGAALQPLGDHGEMHETPMLFGLGDEVFANGAFYRIIGHARYDYGRGWWDEMWGVDGQGHGAWLSIDEGDVACQVPLPPERFPRGVTPPGLGDDVVIDRHYFTVTEIDTATCTAIRGEFPERIQVGDRHIFVNASGDAGELASGEFWEDGRSWSLGHWLDPFEIGVERAS